MQAVVEATGLRTRENVLNSIDPAILEQSANATNLARVPDTQPAATCSGRRESEAGAEVNSAASTLWGYVLRGLREQKACKLGFPSFSGSLGGSVLVRLLVR